MTRKQVFLLLGIGMAALLVVGFVVGAIGSRMFGLPGGPFLHQPGIHLNVQPIWPAEARNAAILGYGGEHNGGEHGDKSEGHGDATGQDGGHGSGDAGHSAAETGSGADAKAKEEHHGEPLGVMELAVTNTLLSAWLTSVLMLVFFIGGARKPRMIPGRWQALIEMLFELVLNFATSILGKEMGRKAFPVVATIFFFVLFNAWLAILLIPIYQAIGFGIHGEDGFTIKAHLFRPAGTDLNMPLALALVSFAFVEYWGFRAHNFGYLKKFFAFGDILRGRPSGIISVFVGLLELISELVRIVSFTFRLFGNMTAGEILVVMITFLVPFVATQFVFGLELLVGLIQSVIFAGLTLVFLSVAVSHEEH